MLPGGGQFRDQQACAKGQRMHETKSALRCQGIDAAPPDEQIQISGAGLAETGDVQTAVSHGYKRFDFQVIDFEVVPAFECRGINVAVMLAALADNENVLINGLLLPLPYG